MANGTRYFTKSLTSAITVGADDNVSLVTILVISGTCTVQGNYSFQGIAPDAITLSAGQTVTVPARPGSNVDGLTITPSGTTNVLMMF